MQIIPYLACLLQIFILVRFRLCLCIRNVPLEETAQNKAQLSETGKDRHSIVTCRLRVIVKFSQHTLTCYIIRLDFCGGDVAIRILVREHRPNHRIPWCSIFPKQSARKRRFVKETDLFCDSRARSVLRIAMDLHTADFINLKGDLGECSRRFCCQSLIRVCMMDPVPHF